VTAPMASAAGAICCARRVEACEGDRPSFGSVAAGDGLRRGAPQRRTRCATGRTEPAGCANGGRPDVRRSTSRSLRVWGRDATTQGGPEHRAEATRAERNGRTTRSYGTRKPHEWRRSRRPSGDRGASRRGGQNPADGTCRVRQTRVIRTLPPMSLKGHRTPGGEARTAGTVLTGGKARTLRGQPSLWEPFGWQHPDRPPD